MPARPPSAHTHGYAVASAAPIVRTSWAARLSRTLISASGATLATSASACTVISRRGTVAATNASTTTASQRRAALAGEERPSVGHTHPQARGPSQPEMLAGEREHAGVDLTHLLAAARIRGRKRPRQRTCPAADVHHPARTGRAQHDSDPAQVVELQVQWVGQIDIGGVHVALPQQPSARSQRVALGDQIAGPGERQLPSAQAGHGA